MLNSCAIDPSTFKALAPDLILSMSLTFGQLGPDLQQSIKDLLGKNWPLKYYIMGSAPYRNWFFILIYVYLILKPKTLTMK